MSSRYPVSIASQVHASIAICITLNGVNKNERPTNIDMNTTPEPVGFPIAASAFTENSLPLSLGSRL